MGGVFFVISKLCGILKRLTQNHKVSVSASYFIYHRFFVGGLFEFYIVCELEHTAEVCGTYTLKLGIFEIFVEYVIENAVVIQILGNRYLELLGG